MRVLWAVRINKLNLSYTDLPYYIIPHEWPARWDFRNFLNIWRSITMIKWKDGIYA
jgi:hypothetical protein